MAKTRKQKKGVMTIPQWRKSFEHMETFTARLLASAKDKTSQRKAFQKEWQRVFHRAVDDRAADAYLSFEAKKHSKGKSKTKKQRGGQTLEGAPLDYSTRPGIYGVYGEFPAYVTSGFDIYDKINQLSPVAGCGVENITPKIPADLGSNKVNFSGGKRRSRSRGSRGSKGSRTRRHRRALKGGASFPDMGNFASYAKNTVTNLGNTMRDFSEAASIRPLIASVPSSVAYDAQSAWKGQALPPTPSANTGNPPYYAPSSGIFNVKVGDINRDLGGEIRS